MTAVILLSVLLPLAYLTLASLTARFVMLRSAVSDRDERCMLALLVGLLWPAALILFIGINSGGQVREELDRQERQRPRSVTLREPGEQLRRYRELGD